jgi:hypothetical protein
VTDANLNDLTEEMKAWHIEMTACQEATEAYLENANASQEGCLQGKAGQDRHFK